MLDFSLTNKKVVITGGTHGIGLAVARRFSERGAKVMITGRRDDGQRVADELNGYFVRADFANDDDIRKVFTVAREKFGQIDVLINNAGYGFDEGPNADVDINEVEKLLQVNLKAVILCMQLATPLLSDGSSVINTSSMSGLRGEPLLATYAITKAGINSLTQSLACELAPRKIRVNAICPGPVKTTYWQDDDPLMPLVDLTMPMARVSTAEELAALYQYLAADESAMLTGQCIVFDGGMTAGTALQLFGALGL